MGGFLMPDPEESKGSTAEQRATRAADLIDASGDSVIEAWSGGEEFTTNDLRALLEDVRVRDERIRAALALHQPIPSTIPGKMLCSNVECEGFYPCPTAKALTGGDPDGE